jgi:hypothetical protein
MTQARPAWGRTALIGSTGFVGGVLSLDVAFDAAYASATIGRIEGEAFDTVVCAGAPAAMWRADADPDGDLRNLERLVATLAKARIGRVVLISTIAVLGDPAAGANETTADFETDGAYGRNRRWLETTLADRFPTTVLRLPALFGPGLKKNFLFDLRHPMPAFLRPEAFASLAGRLSKATAAALAATYAQDAATGLFTLDRVALAGHIAAADLTEAVIDHGFDAPGFSHADSTFQFYGLRRLADDIDAALRLNLDILHLAVEPWRAGDLAEALTGRASTRREASLRMEDMRTRHGSAFGSAGPYLQSRGQVLEAIRRDWDAGAW